ncbi:MAG: transmembrane 220 family protein [Halioglobus sp.]|nr:transmembrane 220 family protein [Halioglobus sp.]
MTSTLLNTIFLIIYLLCAAVQYNDPDRIVWISLYLAAAGMCIAEFRPEPPRWPPRVLGLISVTWIGTLLPSIVGQATLEDIFTSITMTTNAIEQAREIGGLLLVGLWAGALSYRSLAPKS